MGYEEVNSLDADVVISLGKKDKKTGKSFPKQAEGYYLGNRDVESKRGESKIHFLETPEGNLGIWGTTDLNRKLADVGPGTMVRITSTGTRPTPNGDMYTYKVEQDKNETKEVGFSSTYVASNVNETDEENLDSDDSNEDDEVLAAANLRAERKAKVDALLNKNGKSAKN